MCLCVYVCGYGCVDVGVGVCMRGCAELYRPALK